MAGITPSAYSAATSFSVVAFFSLKSKFKTRSVSEPDGARLNLPMRLSFTANTESLSRYSVSASVNLRDERLIAVLGDHEVNVARPPRVMAHVFQRFAAGAGHKELGRGIGRSAMKAYSPLLSVVKRTPEDCKPAVQDPEGHRDHSAHLPAYIDRDAFNRLSGGIGNPAAQTLTSLRFFESSG